MEGFNLATRIISSIFALAFLFVIMFLGEITLNVTIFVIACIGMYEFYKALNSAGYKSLVFVGYISCLTLLYPLINFYYNFKGIDFFQVFFMIIVILFITSMTIYVLKNEKFNFIDVTISLFGVIYVVLLFAYIPLTRYLPKGEYLIWLIFIGACATDTMAYFIGYFFGKHKLLPIISPKKTVEGFFGGIAGSIIGITAFGYYMMSKGIVDKTDIYKLIFLGLLTGIVSQVGDWTASAIKRFANVKDYGNLMPGHGGVLDRFDSIIFIAPMVYYYVKLFL